MGMSSNQIANRANHTRVSHFCLDRFEDKCATHEIKKKKGRRGKEILSLEKLKLRDNVWMHVSRGIN